MDVNGFRIIPYMTWILTVRLYMVCHGSHQYIPNVVSIYTSTMDSMGYGIHGVNLPSGKLTSLLKMAIYSEFSH